MILDMETITQTGTRNIYGSSKAKFVRLAAERETKTLTMSLVSQNEETRGISTGLGPDFKADLPRQRRVEIGQCL